MRPDHPTCAPHERGLAENKRAALVTAGLLFVACSPDAVQISPDVFGASGLRFSAQVGEVVGASPDSPDTFLNFPNARARVCAYARVGENNREPSGLSGLATACSTGRDGASVPPRTPEIRGTDHAIWRRIKLVPFEVRIPDDEKDKELSEKLREELPGILAWIVRGCLDYQELGLGEPEKVEKATAGYRAEMDVLAAFIEDRCVLQAGAETPATPLYKAYREWCEEAGEQPEKQTAFGRRLGERGDLTGFSYTQGPHKGRKGWRGIGLLQE